MPEQQEVNPQLIGNQCKMVDVMQRIANSKPPLNLGMYRTMYMMDYRPYTDCHEHLPIKDLSQKLKLEAQLKKKEFERPVEPQPMKYLEEPECQEVIPPYPVRMQGRVSKRQEAPPLFEEVQEDQQSLYPPVIQEQEEESLPQQTEPCIIPGNVDAPCVTTQEEGQSWCDYHQFILETQRAKQIQLKEIKKYHLGSSAFPPDYITATEPSTYQRDYVHWPRVKTGYDRANRNFSSLNLQDNYYRRDPWMSDYMDNYSIFLKKLNWASRNPVSSFCSSVKPIPHLSHGMSSQKPIAVNAAP